VPARALENGKMPELSFEMGIFRRIIDEKTAV